jgi:hypothetical protein
MASRLGRAVGIRLLPLLLIGCTDIGPTGALVHERVAVDWQRADTRLASLVRGYQAGGTLGFVLRDTPIEEQLYRRAGSSQRGLLWSAAFVSRWPLTVDQLDRWSAQVVGLLADGLGPDVRLAGWERLDATDRGRLWLAYRYALTTVGANGTGEATVVVFARDEMVGLTGAAAIGSRSPVDAVALAHVLAPGPCGNGLNHGAGPAGRE